MTKKPAKPKPESSADYRPVFGDVTRIIEATRRSAARSLNSVMTAAYWLIGRRIVELEQAGEKRAEYGTALIEKLTADLTQRFGRGFSRQNIQQMRLFYLLYPTNQIRQTVSGELVQALRQPICQTVSGRSRTLPRLILVKGTGDEERHPKMLKLIRKAASQLIRRRFTDIPDLTVKTHGCITSAGYQKLTDVSRQTASRDLDQLVVKGVDSHHGSRRRVYYVPEGGMPQMHHGRHWEGASSRR